jgi:hypothetical protein
VWSLTYHCHLLIPALTHSLPSPLRFAVLTMECPALSLPRRSLLTHIPLLPVIALALALGVKVNATLRNCYTTTVWVGGPVSCYITAGGQSVIVGKTVPYFPALQGNLLWEFADILDHRVAQSKMSSKVWVRHNISDLRKRVNFRPLASAL